MKLPLFIITIFLFCAAYGQSSKCDCGGLLSIDEFKKIPILKIAAGERKYFIQNDSANEIFFLFQIIGQSNEYFQVIPRNIDKVMDTGWIHRSYLKIYARNYASKLTLYSRPDEKSKAAVTLAKYQPGTYQILKCSGSWLYVNMKKDKNYKGWLSPDMQCDNPYTNCN